MVDGRPVGAVLVGRGGEAGADAGPGGMRKERVPEGIWVICGLGTVGGEGAGDIPPGEGTLRSHVHAGKYSDPTSSRLNSSQPPSRSWQIESGWDAALSERVLRMLVGFALLGVVTAPH